MSSETGITHPDRLFPSEPGVRHIARALYEHVRELPIVSPHGHVDARLLADDTPFGDPAALFVAPDHYVTRMLHAHGVPLDELGVGSNGLDEAQARRIWHTLCRNWAAFRGTPVRYWLEMELTEIFGVTARLSADAADATFDEIASQLTEPAFRPACALRAIPDRRIGDDRRSV